MIDYFSLLSDEDGDWLPRFTFDGIHPTETAAAAMGHLAVATLTAP